MQKILTYGIFIAMLFISPFLLDSALLSKWTALAIVLILCSLLIIFRSNKSGSNLVQVRNNSPVFYLLTFLWLIRLASIFYTINSADAYFDLAKEALFILLLYFLLALFPSSVAFIKASRIPFMGFLTISLFYAIVQLYPLMVSGEYSASNSYQIKSFFAHRNMFSHILVLSLPFLFLEINSKSKRSYFQLILLFITLVLLFILYCRTAWVAFFFALVVSLIYFIWTKSGFQTILEVIKKNYILVVSSVLVFLGFVFWDINELEKQWYSLSHWHFGSVYNRLKLWEASIGIVEERPFIGSGLSSWKIEVLRFISSSDITNGGFTFYQRPHNDFLWLWSESGILAISTYISVFILIIYRALKSNYSPILLATIFGLAAYLIIAFLSFPKERMEHQVLLSMFFFMALSSNKTADVSTSTKPKNNFLFWNLIALISILFVFGMRLKGEYFTAKGLLNPSNKNWQKRIDNLSSAKSRFYQMDATSTPLDYHIGLFYLNLGKLEIAERHFMQSLDVNPYHTHILNYCASIQYESGNEREAQAYYQRILEIKPDHNDALVNMSVISVRNESVEVAMDYLLNVDSKNITLEHKKIIVVIVKMNLKRIQAESENRETKRHIQRIINDEEWIFDFYKKVLENHEDFENKLMDDVNYLLEIERENG